eukprot:scaffold1541_cov67-Phaeocystis_antarctica.AAC.1
MPGGALVNSRTIVSAAVVSRAFSQPAGSAGESISHSAAEATHMRCGCTTESTPSRDRGRGEVLRLGRARRGGRRGGVRVWLLRARVVACACACGCGPARRAAARAARARRGAAWSAARAPCCSASP